MRFPHGLFLKGDIIAAGSLPEGQLFSGRAPGNRCVFSFGAFRRGRTLAAAKKRDKKAIYGYYSGRLRKGRLGAGAAAEHSSVCAAVAAALSKHLTFLRQQAWPAAAVARCSSATCLWGKKRGTCQRKLLVQ